MKAGQKLEHGGGARAIVVRPPTDGDLQLEPGGEVLLGKRYQCGTCPAEVLVTKAGPAQLVCHGAPMGVARPKTLPSSD